MELRVLKYFLTVADEGNITRAAGGNHCRACRQAGAYIYRSEGCNLRNHTDRRYGSVGRPDAGCPYERIPGEISRRPV